MSFIKHSSWILPAVIISAQLLGGCGYFSSKREEEIKQRLERYQEEADRRADSLRKLQYKKLADTTFGNFEKSMDSLKHSSDSLEQLIKKDIEELKKKNKVK